MRKLNAQTRGRICPRIRESGGRQMKDKYRSLVVHCGLLVFIGMPSIHSVVPKGPHPNEAWQDDQRVQQLERGRPIERELAGGQSHTYQFSLDAGQYVKLVIEQRGIDVMARLSGPDGKLITEFNSESRNQGQETVEQVAEAACVYRLKVRARYGGAAAGKYEIRIEGVRNATDIDRALQRARALHTEFRRLYFASRYDDALEALESVLELREKALGPEHSIVAATLHNLASIYRNKGDYAKAESLHHRARTIWEKTLGPEHPNVAMSLNNLGILYQGKGSYAKAEQAYQRSLAIKLKALEPEHPDVAVTLHNLADLYHDRGDYTNAESIYERVLDMRKKALGPEDPDVAAILTNLAELNRDRGDRAKAEQLHQRALTIYEKSLGPEASHVAMALNNLATLSRDRGDFAKAELLYRRAQAIWGKSPGPEHPLFADSLDELAILYRKRGEYEKAEQLHQRALAIFEKAVGPLRSKSLRNLAILYAAKGDIAQAVAFQTRANAASERNLTLNLTIGSERQKMAYLALFSRETDFTLSLHSQAAPANSQALDLAFTTLLRRKERGLDAMVDMIGALRRNATPQDQAIFDQFIEARSQLAALTLKESDAATPDTYKARLKPLEEKVERLEAELSARSDRFRGQTQPVTLAAVQSALPANSALVEFAVYSPQELQTEKGKPPRYIAYLLSSKGQPKWVDLGDAAVIDRAIDAWRKSLRNPNRTDVNRLARAVDEKVMRPVRPLLGETRRLLIAPDGSLNLIPFAALVDERNRYLIERYAISYLTSGRDLLRLPISRPSENAPMVVANPAFGRASTVVAQQKSADLPPGDQARTQGDQAQIYFQPLPSTGREALAIKAALPGASLLLREQATESAVKQAESPRILHIATHGFFFGDQEATPAETLGGFGDNQLRASDLRFVKWGAKVENPLLRSGLALAGANQGKSGDDDGLLTAMEVAGLDLRGTMLVVLSACDTGVGEVKNGEGVQGLRRALVLAGSESQVMSLWAVLDNTGKDLMTPYYEALRQGKGRSDGLRQAQLQMLRSEDRRHPFYWAAFIQSGEWANLDGQR
jgi:CHAT domain-containing protein/Tfp pilus assembly protein PilF